MILIDDYFEKVEETLRVLPDILQISIEKKKINHLYYGIIKGVLTLDKDFKFSFLEVVDTEKNPELKKQKYKYNLTKESKTLFRYDNAKHYPGLTGFPNHKHLENGEIIGCPEPDLQNVLLEIIAEYKKYNE